MIYKLENDIGEVEIISLLRKGNEKALEMIYQKHHAALVYFAQQYLDNYQEAEDIVAESFFSMWQKRNDFKNMKTIRSFLYTVTRNACINQIRQTNCHTARHEDISYYTEQVFGGQEELIIDQMIKSELMQKLWENAESLPPIRRRIFKMFFKDGLSAFEIAKTLRISVDTVRVQKARALHKLREFFKQRYNKIVLLF